MGNPHWDRRHGLDMHVVAGRNEMKQETLQGVSFIVVAYIVHQIFLEHLNACAVVQPGDGFSISLGP